MQILDETIDFKSWYEDNRPAQFLRTGADAIFDLKRSLAQVSTTPKVLMPWPKMAEDFEFRRQEVTVYAGQNGSGKSLMTGQIALSLMAQNEKVCIASFEMRPSRSVHRMVRQYSRHPITHDFEGLENFTKDKLWFYDHQGQIDAKVIIGVGRYVSQKLGVKHLFIDSLMKCVRAEDDYNGQKAFIEDITSLARFEDMHIHLVHHIRKSSSDDNVPDKMSLKGSGSITDQVDNVFIFYRNKKKERAVEAGQSVDPREHDALLMCEKQRNGEQESAYRLYFHKPSHQFLEVYDGIPHRF